MYIFKTSGETFNSVIENKKHAFKSCPSDYHRGEIALISKNKSSLNKDEKEIKYAMRIKEIREATSSEIENYWPGHGNKWKYIVDMYDRMEFLIPINLDDVVDTKQGFYKGIQTYRKVKEKDKQDFLSYIDSQNIVVDDSNSYNPDETKKAVKQLNKKYKGSSAERKEKTSYVIERNPRITSFLKNHHPDECQICGSPHFKKENGGSYSEVHHVEELSKGGSQATNNCLVLCPTCHRKMHHASVEIDDLGNKFEITINGDNFEAAKNNIS